MGGREIDRAIVESEEARGGRECGRERGEGRLIKHEGREKGGKEEVRKREREIKSAAHPATTTLTKGIQVWLVY